MPGKGILKSIQGGKNTGIADWFRWYNTLSMFRNNILKLNAIEK